MIEQTNPVSNAFEDAARIVEAFSSGVSDDFAELLGRIAAAIRDRALDS